MAMAMKLLRLLRRTSTCRGAPALALARPSPLPAHMPTPPPSFLRRMATASGGDHELLRILKDEIEHERQADAVSQREAKSPPKPFTVDDNPGAQEVFLHRAYNKENIKVTCVFHTQNYPEMDNEEEDGQESEDAPTQVVQMIVKISKGGDDPYLEIQCVTYGDEPVIDRVSYKEITTGPDHLPYEGPQFSDLDDSVQTGFQKYLKARGIDAELGSYLITYLYHKEQREYSKWLRNIEEFITK